MFSIFDNKKANFSPDTIFIFSDWDLYECRKRLIDPEGLRFYVYVDTNIYLSDHIYNILYVCVCVCVRVRACIVFKDQVIFTTILLWKVSKYGKIARICSVNPYTLHSSSIHILLHLLYHAYWSKWVNFMQVFFHFQILRYRIQCSKFSNISKWTKIAAPAYCLNSCFLLRECHHLSSPMLFFPNIGAVTLQNGICE